MSEKLTPTTLGNVLRIKHGWPFLGEHFSDDGKLIVLTPGNFFERGGFKRLYGKEKYYLKEFPSEYLCSEGDLVVAMTQQAEGLLGSTAIIPESGVYLHNQRIGLITHDEKQTDKIYLYYLFMTSGVRQQIRATASGSKVKHTSPERIYEVKIWLPDLPQQKVIGAILSGIERKIAINNAIISELEKAAKLLYDYWFVQFDFPDENGKAYRASGGAMEYNEKLKREIPKGWEVKPLGEELKIKRGNIITEKETSPGVVKVVAAGVEFSYYHSKANCPKNTITVSASGANAGYLNFWQEEIYASDCITIRGNDDVDTLLAYRFLKSMQAIILRKSTGSAQPHVYTHDLAEINMCVIPPHIKEKIGGFYLNINNQMELNNKQTEELTVLRDFLLPLLMNGQVTFRIE